MVCDRKGDLLHNAIKSSGRYIRLELGIDWMSHEHLEVFAKDMKFHRCSNQLQNSSRLLQPSLKFLANQ